MARAAPAWRHPLCAPRRPPDQVLVDIVMPVYNERATLESSIDALRDYLDDSFPFRTVVTIADNGSTDGTTLLAQHLAGTRPGVRVLLLAPKGRGHALRTAWADSDADVVAYMDVDLSTSLAALLPLVGSVLSGHRDLAVGTRLSRSSRVVPRQRLPVRLQGDRTQATGADPAAHRGRPVVLLPPADRLATARPPHRHGAATSRP
ncbi:MAG TPA: glycosyltransferase [Acidimicrobiales bacterium]|nr:glycosyltransferase [Acidimicrobiales bacterium]